MMNKSFLEFIRRKKLFSPKDKVLLALSGGVDSMVMLDLFVKAGFKTGIIHCNFSLRGRESDGDEKFVRRTAAKHKITIHAKRFDTKDRARRSKVSIQMAARELRYAYFEEIRRSGGYDVIATAHHLNDSVETFLLNMIRGTGISGLTGISPRSGNVVRPLLFATREQIREYAGKNKITWREDSSNKSDKYSRNLIRHKVVPVLLKLNPNFLFSMNRTMERAAGMENFMNHWIRENRKHFMRRRNNVVIIDFLKLPGYPDPVLLHFLIREYGFSHEQSGMIFRSLDHRPGGSFYSSSHVLTIDRGKLVITPVKGGEPGSWEVRKGQKCLVTDDGDRFDFSIVKKPAKFGSPGNTALLDASKITYPLWIRGPRTGDRFRPYGMKGKQKLSDFMINNKIPRNLKSRIKLLISNDEIAWVAGFRTSETFKVDKDTRSVLKIQFSGFHEEPF